MDYLDNPKRRRAGWSPQHISKKLRIGAGIHTKHPHPDLAGVSASCGLNTDPGS
jgi:hypothetical protein